MRLFHRGISPGKKRLLEVGLDLAGASLLLGGLYLVWPPLALLVAGVGLIVTAWVMHS